MRLTKYIHSCVRVDDGDRSLIIDPGMFSEAGRALDGAGAVLITHEHADHLDADAVIAACEHDADLRVWCPKSVSEQLDRVHDRVTTVGAGGFTAAGFWVRTFGGQHALIHGEVPVVPNLGYLVDDAVYHPGDAFTVPDARVATLLLPIHAPWSKVGEVLDFMVSIRAGRVHQVHDGLLNERGMGVVEGHVERFAKRHGSRYEHLDAGQSVDL